MKKRSNVGIIAGLSLLFISGLIGQKQSKLDQALRFIENQKTAWSLTAEDISDLAVSDMYQTEHNGVTHIYLIQRYSGIEIYNAITSVHITSDGKIYGSPSRFYSGINQKVNTTKSKLNAVQALTQVVKHLDIPNALVPNNASRTNEGKTFIAKSNFTHNDIAAKLMYCPDKTGNLRLAWDLDMDMSTSNDYWSIRVDAVNGEILDQVNRNIKCNFKHPGHSACIENEKVLQSKNIPVKEALIIQNTAQLAKPTAGATYNVVPIPYESPRHHDRQLLVNPASPKASPFGWHDTNGVAGAEYTITRGNNVHAYPDRNGDNLSDKNEPDGGANLIFDFPFDQTAEPDSYLKAATSNLFYTANMMHDMSYGFGFDEVSGNFQSNNYGKAGLGNDYVLAEAQDGSGTDNANFATPADGNNGRMQMYLWLSAGVETYIIKPDSLVGSIDSRRASGWGGAPPPNIDAPLVLANDHSNRPTYACVNGMRKSDVQGKIVLIDRGSCDFSLKAANAQDSGAVGVIICNYEDAFVTMGAGQRAGQVKIPAYFTTKSICNRLRMAIDSGGVTVEIRPAGATAGPDTLDGDFDNGVICHEYGHGISTRLTGGPSNSNCLGNAEQMGEGWSDFMTLIMQAKPGDVGTTPRGIGTYVENEKPNGLGIRRRPYCTDMSVNEFTYKDIDAEAHDLGEVWATVLWDLYWAFAGQYGYDPDFNNKTSGNNIAIQLVMDGMKMQVCSPGFIDGRNAILQADSMNNQGKNFCLIWSVFARRGMGYFASQGSRDLVGDEIESYLPSLVCINKVLIEKKAGYYKNASLIKNDVVKPGDQFSLSILVDNYKPDSVTNIIIKDSIPAGCTYVIGSAKVNGPGKPTLQINGNQLIWTFPSFKSLETDTITYKLTSSPGIASTTLWYDDVETNDASTNPDKYWDNTFFKGDVFWLQTEQSGVNDSWGWEADEGGVKGSEGADDVALYLVNPFQLYGEDPSLLFYHRFNTEKGFDGGILEVSTDGFNWTEAKPEEFSLNGYTGLINYQTFVIPGLSAFSGQSDGFIPTVLSLANYNNQKVQVRFHWANDSLNISPDLSTIPGWFVDNIEFILPKFYNGQVCVTTNEGDNTCTSLSGKGVLANSNKIVGTNNANQKSDFKIYPNPAGDYFLLKLDAENQFKKLIIRNVNGQELKTLDIGSNSSLMKVSTNDLPKGMVLIELASEQARKFSKLFIK